MNQLTFGIMADLHGDIMPDGELRLGEFVKDMNKRNVDFIIQVGDLCQVGTQGKKLTVLYNEFLGPKHHVLGNHDADDCKKKQAVDILGMGESYYSFRIRDYKCIILDTNYHYDEETDTCTDFDIDNVLTGRSKPYIPPTQLQWLKGELEEDCKIILFSHASLSGDGTGIFNKDVIWQIIDNAHEEAGYKKVIACFHGHDHFDSTQVHHGVYSLGIPSISNQWLGPDHCNTDVEDALLEANPELQHVVPYREPLYTVVTCNEQALYVEGKETEYVGGKPSKYGRNMKIGYDYMSSILKEKVLPY